MSESASPAPPTHLPIYVDSADVSANASARSSAEPHPQLRHPAIDLTNLSDSDDSPAPRADLHHLGVNGASASKGSPLNGSSSNGSGNSNRVQVPEGSAASPKSQLRTDHPASSSAQSSSRPPIIDSDGDDFTITASTGPTRQLVRHPPNSPARAPAMTAGSSGLSVNGSFSPSPFAHAAHHNYTPFHASRLGQASAAPHTAPHTSGFGRFASGNFASGPPATPSLPGQMPSINGGDGSSAAAAIDVDTIPQVPRIAPAPPPPPNVPEGRRPICIGAFMARAIMLYPNAAVVAGAAPPPGTRAMWEVVNFKGAEMIRVKLKLRKANGHARPDEPWTSVSVDTVQVLTHDMTSYIGDLDKQHADILITMLDRGLCRLEGYAMREPTEGVTFDCRLNVMVFTLPSNVQYISQTLLAHNVFLLDPMPTYDPQRHADHPEYHNAHGGGERAYRLLMQNRVGGYGAYNGGLLYNAEREKAKQIEVQREQVDEVFKNLQEGLALEQSDPGPWIKTELFPHQRKALTFLLQGEQDWSSLRQARKNADRHLSKREASVECGTPASDKSSARDMSSYKSDTSRSLWDPVLGADGERVKSWKNKITGEKLRGKKPKDCKGAILADDMGLGKTLSVVSLIAATHRAAKEWGEKELEKIEPPTESEDDGQKLPVSVMSTKVFGMPDVDTTEVKSKKRRRDEKEDVDARARRSLLTRRSKATLLVCPMSTITNWEDQIKEHWNGRVEVIGGASPPVKSDRKAENGYDPEWDVLRVYIYHGTSRKADPRYLGEFDVVITSYSTLANEYSKQCATGGGDDSTPVTGANSDEDGIDSRGSRVKGDAPPEIKAADVSALLKRKGTRAKLGQGDTSPLQAIDWFRVVLDEAHSIKSSATVACKASCSLEADRRIALTGTPIQNRIDDVWALFKFLRISPVDEKEVFVKYIQSPCKAGDQVGVARLQLVMRACCLRRTKDTAENGVKILSLPPRREMQTWLTLRDDERAVYDARRDVAQNEVAELKAKQQLTKNYAHVLRQLLLLRQTCDHVDLPNMTSTEDDYDGTIMDYELAVQGIEKYGLTQARALSFICTQKDLPDGVTCAQCGQDFGQYFPSIGLDGVEEIPKTEPDAKKKPKDYRPLLMRCMHVYCQQCFKKAVYSKWPRALEGVSRQCEVCQRMMPLARDVIEVCPPTDNPDDMPKKTITRRKWQRDPAEPPSLSTKMQFLHDDLMKYSRRNKYSPNYDPFFSVPDGNDEDDDVVELDEDGAPLVTKSIVFSQWTTMLDRIEDMLNECRIKCCRLDGTMSREERARQIEQLRTSKSTEVMLVSTRAGGVGLNLTAASRAYLVDPYWNPSVESQAIDRIHRLGQKRPVTAIKLMISESVEMKLADLQRKKADLAQLSLKNMSRKELMEQKADQLASLFSL